jgi:acetyltransferase
MINLKLIAPGSIAVIGGSNDLHKPGGKLVANLKSGTFKGDIFIVNPKETKVQELDCYSNLSQLPNVDLAILAIPAKVCFETVEYLLKYKQTGGFIIISAGFSEEGPDGAQLEKEITRLVNDYGASLIGPNCIGIVNLNYSAIFTSPIPPLEPRGCDLISSSGSTAVFIVESSLPKGLTFSSIYSVGNAAQIAVEDLLEYFDATFDPYTSSKVKLLYLESIKNPDKLLKHATSLIQKGCKIAAIKAGGSEAGSRAATSHTGALANPDLAVEALFRKAGIVRCFGREELSTVASVFMHKELKGKRFAIITHAGGPAVMLTDALSTGGLEIPKLEGVWADELLKKLPFGSSVKNPIDFLATGTSEHLELVIDYCENQFENIDAIMVIFGSTGLSKVYRAYDLLHKKITTCKKPIFCILPSLHSAKEELECFLANGHINFPDEVQLGRAITKISNTPKPADVILEHPNVNISEVQDIISKCKDEFISTNTVREILDATGIPLVKTYEITSRDELIEAAWKLNFPLAIKVVGPIHKSDVGGVTLNIKSEKHLLAEYERMMQIRGAKAVTLQPMLSGLELFLGAKYEQPFGHIIMCGLGGIFVEALGDISSGLAPLSKNEATSMIRSLKSYKILNGTRGRKGINEDLFADIIVKLSVMLRHNVEIKELDLNPLIALENDITVVDARIRVEKI